MRKGLPIALLAALAAPWLFSTPAHAEARQVGCSELRGAIEAAGSEPETIVLDGLCEKGDLGEPAIAIPAGANLTLRGAPGTTSGIDGTGMSGDLIDAAHASRLAIEDLTFLNGTHEGALRLQASRLTIAGDAFLYNETSRSAGGGLFAQASGPDCPGAGGPPAITVVASTFRGNAVFHLGSAATGAGAYLADLCAGAATVVEGNVFESNTLRSRSSATADGGGLFVGAEGQSAPPLTQAGNVFAGNDVEVQDETAPQVCDRSSGGGGEWVAGMSLSSVRDRFSSNTVCGSDTGPPSGGAGLGLAAGGELQQHSCGPGAAVAATLADDVLAGNSIVGGAPPGRAGAAIQLGCGENASDRLTLLDSTVTENSSVGAAGGVAGIAGQLGETLTVANSIVDGDTGGAELGGFTGPLDVSYSDLCAPGSSGPIAGTGNICAAPRLAGPPGDVHETVGSPTREAGSNAMVPAGLATDFYGAPRIAGGTIQATCAEGHVQLAGPVVDMGAAELSEPSIHPLRVLCPAFRRSSFTFPSVSVRPGGALLLTFRGLTKGTLLAKAAIPETRTVVIDVHGRRRRVRRSMSVAYGGADRLGTLAPVLRMRLVPNRKALGTLRRHGRLNLSLTITYAANRLFPATQSRTVRVRWIAPRRRR